MKLAIIIVLVVFATVLGFSVSFLQKELLSARKNAAFYEKRSDNLQRELMRVNRVCDEKERFLNEIEQSITELESKVDLETLERYIPKKTWGEIEPIIDKLKAFQETRESNNLSKSGRGRKDD
jgi:Tfp pilus assembly protein PilN